MKRAVKLKAKRRPKCRLEWGCNHRIGFSRNVVPMEEWLCPCLCHKTESGGEG